MIMKRSEMAFEIFTKLVVRELNQENVNHNYLCHAAFNATDAFINIAKFEKYVPHESISEHE